mmetsp:Transcript_25351/g.53020  ORF Transcript_25351/g.53020 Transcript_25351/m.53020 type:complete len:248 (-) Transcript_25351:496-1239(-)
MRQICATLKYNSGGVKAMDVMVAALRVEVEEMTSIFALMVLVMPTAMAIARRLQSSRQRPPLRFRGQMCPQLLRARRRLSSWRRQSVRRVFASWRAYSMRLNLRRCLLRSSHSRRGRSRTGAQAAGSTCTSRRRRHSQRSLHTRCSVAWCVLCWAQRPIWRRLACSSRTRGPKRSAGTWTRPTFSRPGRTFRRTRSRSSSRLSLSMPRLGQRSSSWAPTSKPRSHSHTSTMFSRAATRGTWSHMTLA